MNALPTTVDVLGVPHMVGLAPADHPDLEGCLGTYIYRERLILIREDLDPVIQMRTLAHEIAHAYWTLKFGTADDEREEAFCDTFELAFCDLVIHNKPLVDAMMGDG